MSWKPPRDDKGEQQVAPPQLHLIYVRLERSFPYSADYSVIRIDFATRSCWLNSFEWDTYTRLLHIFRKHVLRLKKTPTPKRKATIILTDVVLSGCAFGYAGEKENVNSNVARYYNRAPIVLADPARFILEYFEAELVATRCKISGYSGGKGIRGFAIFGGGGRTILRNTIITNGFLNGSFPPILTCKADYNTCNDDRVEHPLHLVNFDHEKFLHGPSVSHKVKKYLICAHLNRVRGSSIGAWITFLSVSRCAPEVGIRRVLMSVNARVVKLESIVLRDLPLAVNVP